MAANAEESGSQPRADKSDSSGDEREPDLPWYPRAIFDALCKTRTLVLYDPHDLPIGFALATEICPTCIVQAFVHGWDLGENFTLGRDGNPDSSTMIEQPRFRMYRLDNPTLYSLAAKPVSMDQNSVPAECNGNPCYNLPWMKKGIKDIMKCKHIYESSKKPKIARGMDLCEDCRKTTAECVCEE